MKVWGFVLIFLPFVILGGMELIMRIVNRGKEAKLRSANSPADQINRDALKSNHS